MCSTAWWLEWLQWVEAAMQSRPGVGVGRTWTIPTRPGWVMGSEGLFMDHTALAMVSLLHCLSLCVMLLSSNWKRKLSGTIVCSRYAVRWSWHNQMREIECFYQKNTIEDDTGKLVVPYHNMTWYVPDHDMTRCGTPVKTASYVFISASLNTVF